MAAFVALIWLRDAGRSQAGKLVALFAFGVLSYLLCPPMARQWNLGVLEAPFFVGCFGVAVFFYLMARAIFDDGFRLRWWHGALLVTAEVLGVSRWLLTERWGDHPDAVNAASHLLLLHQLLSLGLTGLALALAARGWSADLVEPRRRLRLAFVLVSGAYVVGIVATEIFLRGASASPDLELANVSAILVLTVSFAVAMTSLRPAFAPTKRQAPRSQTSEVDADSADLVASLLHSMVHQKAYRDDRLTIGKLAKQLDTQEYRLRRAVNGSLGYRNFNQFLNHYRLNEARTRLADPAETALPILSIALECGYASIGPFNRAFKESTGMTPSAYRRDALANH